MSLTLQRGKHATRGLARQQEEIALEAHFELMEEYVRIYRVKQAEEVRARKRAEIFKSPAATARLMFIERAEGGRK